MGFTNNDLNCNTFEAIGIATQQAEMAGMVVDAQPNSELCAAGNTYSRNKKTLLEIREWEIQDKPQESPNCFNKLTTSICLE